MKSRLNLSIDPGLLAKVKRIAQQKNMSLSEMVEEYFKHMSRPLEQKTTIDLIESLPVPNMDVEGDLKDEFHRQQSNKYGF